MFADAVHGWVGRGETTFSRRHFKAIYRVPPIRTRRIGHQGGFLGLPVLCPLLLPGGLNTALALRTQHPAAWKLCLGCNISLEEKCVTPSGVRVPNGKQRCARLLQVARKRTTIEAESPREDPTLICRFPQNDGLLSRVPIWRIRFDNRQQRQAGLVLPSRERCCS